MQRSDVEGQSGLETDVDQLRHELVAFVLAELAARPSAEPSLSRELVETVRTGVQDAVDDRLVDLHNALVQSTRGSIESALADALSGDPARLAALRAAEPQDGWDATHQPSRPKTSPRASADGVPRWVIIGGAALAGVVLLGAAAWGGWALAPKPAFAPETLTALMPADYAVQPVPTDRFARHAEALREEGQAELDPVRRQALKQIEDRTRAIQAQLERDTGKGATPQQAWERSVVLNATLEDLAERPAVKVEPPQAEGAPSVSAPN